MALLLAFLGGCSDDAKEAEDTRSAKYLMNIAIPTPEGDATSFLVFSERVDVGNVSIDEARELGGWIDVHSRASRVFVAFGDAPEITSQAVDGDGRLSDEQTISFQTYGAASAGYGLNSYASDRRAYFTSSALERVIWDPLAMEIVGTLSLDGVREAPEGLTNNASYDRGVLVRDDQVFHSIYTANWDTAEFGPSNIAVWNHESDELVSVLESDCPMLDAATKDDEGNIYYSPWLHAVVSQLTVESAPKTCAVRIPAGAGELDAAWDGDLSALVDGRPVINLQYAGHGIFFAGVLHTEELVEPIDADQIYGANWRLWRFNLEAGTASIVEELDYNDGAFTLLRLDGQAYLILSTLEDSTGYAVEADGSLREVLHSKGRFTSQIVKL